MTDVKQDGSVGLFALDFPHAVSNVELRYSYVVIQSCHCVKILRMVPLDCLRWIFLGDWVTRVSCEKATSNKQVHSSYNTFFIDKLPVGEVPLDIIIR